MNTNQPATSSESRSEHRLWARVGVTLMVDEGNYQKIIKGDHETLKAVLLGNTGSVCLDGETYFPDTLEQNSEIKYDFNFAPTPLHRREGKTSPERISQNPATPPASLSEKISEAEAKRDASACNQEPPHRGEER